MSSERQVEHLSQRASLQYPLKLTGVLPRCTGRLGGANSGPMHRSKRRAYSITSSARASRDGGAVRPSALAVLRLMTSSNFVGCSTGKLAGLAPLRILSTYTAVRRYMSGRCGPYEINPPSDTNSL